MARRGDPNVLRLVVLFLRSSTKLTQAQFGREAGVDQAEVSRYELGLLAPSDQTLRRMAQVARIDWLLVVHLRQFYSALLTIAARQSSVRDFSLTLNLAMEPVLLAVTPYLLEARTAERPQPSPGQERLVAAGIWEALEEHPISFRRRLIELSPHSGSWALVVRVCEASVKRAADNAKEALELAELALSMAGRVTEGSWRSRLEGYCWAHIGHAWRIGDNFEAAEEAFFRCRSLWQAGADPVQLLPDWLPSALEASLRRDQRRFTEALELLDRATTSLGEAGPNANLILLLEKEHVFEQMGEIQASLSALKQAAPLLETSQDPRLSFAFHFKWVNNLCHLGQYSEADERLTEVRELASEQANGLDLIRVGWLTARVAAGQGRRDEAIKGLEKVRHDFTRRELAFDAALSSLDLAVLWLQAGRMADVKEVAVAMGWIFKAKGIHREALAALKLFYEAALQETATEELARQVIGELKKLAVMPM